MALHSSPLSRWSRMKMPQLLAIVVMLGTTMFALPSGAATNAHVGPEGVLMFNVPNLASSSSSRTGAPVDGITCRRESQEVVKYHIHVHVSIYVKGKMYRLPAGVGITKPQLVEHYATGLFDDVGLYDCLYWLHTHVADGIVHVEAPAKGNFTLGQFFDIWNQPLSPTQVGPDHGRVVIFENGKRLSGNPRSTPLLAQAAIQIDVGNPVEPFQPFAFKVTGGCGEGTTSCSVAKS